MTNTPDDIEVDEQDLENMVFCVVLVYKVGYRRRGLDKTYHKLMRWLALSEEEKVDTGRNNHKNTG